MIFFGKTKRRYLSCVVKGESPAQGTKFLHFFFPRHKARKMVLRKLRKVLTIKINRENVVIRNQLYYAEQYLYHEMTSHSKTSKFYH